MVLYNLNRWIPTTHDTIRRTGFQEYEIYVAYMYMHTCIITTENLQDHEMVIRCVKELEENCKHNKATRRLPGIARKRLPAFNAGPLPWLVAPAIAGAEFDSSTKNEHETYTRIVLYLQRKGLRRKRKIPFRRMHYAYREQLRPETSLLEIATRSRLIRTCSSSFSFSSK